MTIASIRVGLDLDLFYMLSETSEPLSLTMLAEETGADPVLLGLQDALTVSM